MTSKDLDRIASRQIGLVTTGQLRTLGLSSRQIEWRVSQRALIRVRYGVYRIAGAPVLWEQSVLSAVLAAKAAAVVSHQTAAAVWQLRYGDRHSSGIHITADRPVRVNGVTSHVAALGSNEFTRCMGIPITTVERTIIDLADVLDVRRLGEVVDDALRRRMLRLEDLRSLVNGANKTLLKTLDPIHQVLADRIVGYRPDDSDFETKMNAEWERLGLPPAQRQYRVQCGRRRYRLDLALPEVKVGIEWDSLAYHGTRSGIDNDSNRRAELTAAGWLILSFTWNSPPKLIADAVRRVWQERVGLPLAADLGTQG